MTSTSHIKTATVGLEFRPFTQVNGTKKGWAHTFAAAVQLEFLPGWVHRAAAHQVTLWQLYFYNGKKIQTQFHKEKNMKKTPYPKSIILSICGILQMSVYIAFLASSRLSLKHFGEFSQTGLLCMVPHTLTFETVYNVRDTMSPLCWKIINWLIGTLTTCHLRKNKKTQTVSGICFLKINKKERKSNRKRQNYGAGGLA